MRLELPYSDKISDSFLYFLCAMMKKWFYEKVDFGRMRLYENYLAEQFPDNQSLTSEQICKQALDHFFISKFQSSIVVYVEENVKLEGYDMELSSVIKMMNYGVLGIDPYPIFSDMFDYVAENFEEYQIMFDMGVK